MSFPNIPIKNLIDRKEQDSLKATHFQIIFPIQKERASVFASKGSLSLEAAIVIPIFFFAVLCLVFLLEMMAIRVAIRNALTSVGKELSQQAYVSAMISTPAIREKIVKQVGKERIERSMIVHGAEGIDCSNSTSNWSTAIMDLSVKYRVEIPVLMFRIPIIFCEETLRVKGWTGYVASGSSENTDVVYITDYGTVYHEDISCTYLEIAVRGIIANTIGDARNQSGGKYYACEKCGKEAHCGILYVADYGDRYHTSLNCKKIQRNVYAVLRHEVLGRGGCSKCVK